METVFFGLLAYTFKGLRKNTLKYVWKLSVMSENIEKSWKNIWLSQIQSYKMKEAIAIIWGKKKHMEPVSRC